MPTTAYADPPTFTPLQKLTAALQNQIGDAIRSMYWWSQAGSIPYSYSADQLEELTKPSVDSLMQFLTGDGIPSWVAKTSIGGIHAVGIKAFAPDTTFSAHDVTGATVTLTLAVQCTVLVFAIVTCYSTLANEGVGTDLWPVIDGTAVSNDNGSIFNGSSSTPRNEVLPLLGVKQSVAAGSRICKLYAGSDSGHATYVTRGYMVAMAFVEN